MSAKMTQPSRIAQARHARALITTLAATTASAISPDTTMALADGTTIAYSRSPKGSHRHCRPVAPVSRLFLSRLQENAHVVAAVGRCGWVVDLRNARRNAFR